VQWYSTAALVVDSSDIPDYMRSCSKLWTWSVDSFALPQPLAHVAAVVCMPKHPGTHWPAEVFADSTTRVWYTYRLQFQPIGGQAMSALQSEIGGRAERPAHPPQLASGRTSDVGWGCTLLPD
jgi:hypothetical protein